jgi:SAM-dependent methyltransferase
MAADEDTQRLAGESLAAGDATGWFERLYSEAQAGTAEVPWDRPAASALLSEWAARSRPGAVGRRALVVGCGLGRDAEFVAGLGFATTAFDISDTAVRVARERHPGTPVDYVVADLLDPPPSWRHGFDLVVESNNVQALPRTLREQAIAQIGTLVAPGGTLLVLAAAATPRSGGGPPWPLNRADIDAFAADGLAPTSIAEIPDAEDPERFRWRAEFHRPPPAPAELDR